MPNELPETLKAFRQFETWLENGAQQEEPLPTVPPNSAPLAWQGLDRWNTHENSETRDSPYPLVPLRDVLEERREFVHVDGDLGDWQAITIKFSGEVVPRERDKPFKGAMFAAYPGDLVFSKIDARNGAVGVVPESMARVVVTSEYPIFIPCAEKLRSAYLRHLLRAEHFRGELQRKASGTSGRKCVTPDGFQSLEIPLPSLDEQDDLVADFARADEMEREAARLRQTAWTAFESALFTNETDSNVGCGERSEPHHSGGR
ncbi:MAG: hypothetical protein H6981_11645 [Gammaproteobacteria bacterium]|nr:hypothetical protein [Gammaproteobacteria bacterium]MCP5137441.1 hypothetical protein [Gammaproteobacteria bacterium]